MAKSWQYPRWRRVAMQGTMWLILAATVGLAALVNRHQRHALVPALDTKSPITLGNSVKVFLPANWAAPRSEGPYPFMPPAPRTCAGGDTPPPSEPWQLEQLPANSWRPSSIRLRPFSLAGRTMPTRGCPAAGAAATT